MQPREEQAPSHTVLSILSPRPGLRSGHPRAAAWVKGEREKHVLHVLKPDPEADVTPLKFHGGT